jgi:dihydrofolate reductase
MRKVIVSEFISLDGVIEAPGGEDSLGALGGWTIPYWNEQAAKFKLDEIFGAGALLLGRKTYQGFAAAWPSRTDEEGFADRMNNLPKYIVSTTLKEVAWNNSRLIKENITEAISGLKEQPGQDILVFGSGDLIHTLMQHDLIDEYRLLVYPVVLGRGKRLFQSGIHLRLKLIESTAFSTGVMMVTYQAVKT